VAKAYSLLDREGSLLLGDHKLEDSDIQGAAGFVRRSVNNMLKWAGGIIGAERQEEEGRTSSKFLGIQSIRYARCPMVLQNGLGENNYRLGWFRHTLPPSWLSSIGPNFALLPDPPIIGQRSLPRLMLAY
jgi:hypothetical protein